MRTCNCVSGTAANGGGLLKKFDANGNKSFIVANVFSRNGMKGKQKFNWKAFVSEHKNRELSWEGKARAEERS